MPVPRASPAAPDAVSPASVRRALRRWHEPDVGRTELAADLGLVGAWLAAAGRADTPIHRAEALRAVFGRGLDAMRQAGYAGAADLLYRQYVRQDAVMLIADDLALGERGYFKRQRAAVETLAATLATLEADAAAVASAAAPAAIAAAVTPPIDQTVSPAPFQAPAAPAWWVGRADDLAWLEREIAGSAAAPDPIVVGLVGMGGLGKTALATHAAHRLRDRFPNGVLWLNLAHADLDTLLLHVAGAFGAIERVARLDDPAARAATVRELLNRRQALVVLDDAQSDGQCEPLLPSAGPSRVVVTTRRGDLRVLQAVPVLRLQGFAEAESVELLRRAIGDARVQADPAGAAAVAACCAHLPLAVDVSARLLARRPGWSLGDFAARLGRALAGGAEPGAAGVADAARVVEASVDASVAQLAPGQRALFLAAGAFVDQIDAGAVAAIVDVPVDAWEAGEWLEQGVDRSLVLRAGGDRYRLHPLIRDYARARRDPHDLRPRLVAHFAARVEAADRSLRGAAWQHEVAWFDAMLPEIEASRAWALAHPGDGAAERLLQACGGRAHRYLERRTDYALWRRWSEDGLAAAERAGDGLAVAACAAQLGLLHYRLGARDRAEPLYARARDGFEAAGDGAGAASARLGLAGIHLMRGEVAEAEAACVACLAAAEALGDRELAARAHNLLGLTHSRQGHTADAIAQFERSIAAADEAGNAVLAGFAHSNLAEMCRRDGRLEAGIAHARRALDVAVRIDDPRRLTRCLDALGELYLAAPDLAAADLIYARMVAVAEPYAGVDAADFVAAEIGRGRVWTALGRWADAAASLERALDLSRQAGMAYLEAEACRYLAEHCLALPEREAARAAELAARAWTLHTGLGRTYTAGLAWRTLVAAAGSEATAKGMVEAGA